MKFGEVQYRDDVWQAEVDAWTCDADALRSLVGAVAALYESYRGGPFGVCQRTVREDERRLFFLAQAVKAAESGRRAAEREEDDMSDDMEQRYAAALAKLPPWRCGRLDLNTYLPEPATVGRVTSDVVRYVYFEDGQEVVVLGQRADEIAYAASKYRELLAESGRRETEEKDHAQ
jgi:hypothetical protein